MGKGKTLSMSELIEFGTCKRRWYLHRVSKNKGSPFLSLIIGSAVHDFIAYWLHKKTKSGREFYYLTEKAALKSFRRYWYTVYQSKYVANFNPKLLHWGYGQARKNLANYLLIAKGKGMPLGIEKEFRIFVPELGYTFVGKIDQIRSTKPEWAKEMGISTPTKVLIDLKTGFPRYWPKHEEATEKDKLQAQTGLVNDIQPTMYYFLFEKEFGRYPDAFLFLFLGGEHPRIVPTTRSQQDIDNLFEIVRDFRKSTQGMDMGEYPKTSNTYNCSYCQFWEACWGKEDRPDISPPLGVRDTAPVQDKEEPVVAKPQPKQLRLKLKSGSK